MTPLNKSSFLLHLLLPLLLAMSFLACSQHHPGTGSLASDDLRQSGEKGQSKEARVSPPAITPTPELEVTFGSGLKIVPKSLKLENQGRRYKISVVYPQVEGTTRAQFSKLNRRIKALVTDEYSWPLAAPTKNDLRYYEKWPGFFNTVNLNYEVPLATDELVSIYFDMYHYGIGAAHSVQHSFAVNYDMKSGRILTLAELFEPGGKHLKFISRYCLDQLSRDNSYVTSDPIIQEVLAPKAKNFESWNITKKGIQFSFDACRVDGCAAGKKQVEISFAALKPLLNPNGPLRMFIENSASE